MNFSNRHKLHLLLALLYGLALVKMFNEIPGGGAPLKEANGDVRGSSGRKRERALPCDHYFQLQTPATQAIPIPDTTLTHGSHLTV